MLPVPVQGGQPAPKMPATGMGTGAATQPTQQAGQAQKSAAAIATATKMLTEALPGLGIDSPARKTVLKFLTDIAKDVNTEAVTPQAQMQQLISQARQQQAGQTPPNLNGPAQGAAPAPQPPMPAPVGNG